MAVACPGEKSASGQKVSAPEVHRGKPTVTDGKHREKGCSSADCTPDNVVVENNYLSNTDITTFTEKYAAAKTDAEKEQLLADLKKLDVTQQEKALATGIPVNEQKAELEKLKTLGALPDCNAQCQQLVAYSISELEPVANNPELHKKNLNKAILAGVIFGLTVEKPTANSPISRLTKEQQQLIRSAETITTAKGIQNPFPRDLNEKVLGIQLRLIHQLATCLKE